MQAEEDRPAKRSRTLVACLQCKKSRARCEPVSGSSCHRCATLNRPCSFLTEPPPGYASPTPATSFPGLHDPTPFAPRSASPAIEPASVGYEPVLDVSSEIVEELQRFISDTLARRIPQGEEQPLIVLSEVATSRQECPTKPRSMLQYNPLQHVVDLLALVGMPDAVRTQSVQTDPRWLGREANLPDELASICDAQAQATWTKSLVAPTDLFALTEGMAIAKLRLKRLDMDIANATRDQRIFKASLLVSEASLAILERGELPKDLVSSVATLLSGIDEDSETYQLLGTHAKLLSALESCRAASRRRPALSTMETDLEHISDTSFKLEEAYFDAQLAHSCASANSMPYLFGLLIQAGAYRAFSRHYAMGWIMRATLVCDPEQRKELHENDFRRFAHDYPAMLLDIVSQVIIFGTVWPAHLATAPDTLYVGIACVLVSMVRTEMTFREWYGNATHNWSKKAQVLRKLAGIFAPASSQSPLAGRALSLRLARLCAALSKVVTNSSMPELSLDYLLSAVGWEHI